MTSLDNAQVNRITNNPGDDWMPFSANRQFKAEPRRPDSAEDMYSPALIATQAQLDTQLEKLADSIRQAS
ncbi:MULTISPECIES: hypothetical protein [Pseudomonas]|uniref:hypothetical protein n=1 Tax=Pseudomonas TaxID=286 RepID=UPI001554651E|nr:hypothetical protein [Pseudomonas tumuqii]